MGWGRGWCGKVEFGQKVGSLGMEGCGKVGNRVLDEFLNMERVVDSAKRFKRVYIGT